MRIMMMGLLASIIAVVFISCSGVSYKDGDYTGTYDVFDGHGWKPLIAITVKGGKISGVKFDYINSSNQLRSIDDSYIESTNDKSTALTFDVAVAELENELEARQGTDVAPVEGAPYSSGIFNRMAGVILEKAKTGDKSETILTMDCDYSVSDTNLGTDGYRYSLDITFGDGKITNILFDAFNKDNKSRTGMETNFSNAAVSLEKSLLEAQSVDNMAMPAEGVAYSDKFVELAKEAFSVRQGN